MIREVLLRKDLARKKSIANEAMNKTSIGYAITILTAVSILFISDIYVVLSLNFAIAWLSSVGSDRTTAQ